MYEQMGSLATAGTQPVAVETWTEPSFRTTWLRWNPDADDCSHSLYRPDCAVPELSFERLRRATIQSAAGRLAMAVLEDAVDCFQKHLFSTRSSHRRLFREAEAWLFADSRGRTSDAVFTFDFVCDSLGIERDVIRRGLMDWRDRKIAEHEARNRPNQQPRREGPEHREAA